MWKVPLNHLATAKTEMDSAVKAIKDSVTASAPSSESQQQSADHLRLEIDTLRKSLEEALSSTQALRDSLPPTSTPTTTSSPAAAAAVAATAPKPTTRNLPESQLYDLVHGLFTRHGVEPISASALANTVTVAQRDGSASHGLARLPAYLSTLASGYINLSPQMKVTRPKPSVVFVDADNGFAQGALARCRHEATRVAHEQGICLIEIHNSHHFGSLWVDLEPFASATAGEGQQQQDEQQSAAVSLGDPLMALSVVNTRNFVVMPGGTRTVLGTNPIAFATPRGQGHPPLVWDQATSARAHGEVLLAHAAGHQLPDGVGVDATMTPTKNPAAILNGGALLPFGAHKGFMISLMVEVLAAALTGSRFGFEDATHEYPGARTCNAGQVIVLMDPNHARQLSYRAKDSSSSSSSSNSSGNDERTPTSDPNLFTERLERLLHELADAGTTRFPGDRRYKQRAVAMKEGIPVTEEYYKLLQQ